MNEWIKRLLLRIPDLVFANKLLFWAVFVVLSALALKEALNYELNFSPDSILVEGDSVQEVNDKFRSTFSHKDNILYIVYRPKDGDVFSFESLKTIQAVTDGLLDMKAGTSEAISDQALLIRNVVSITNAPFTRVTDDNIYTSDFVPSIPNTPAALEALKKKALDYEKYTLSYFSKDMEYGAFVVEFDDAFVADNAVVSTEILEFDDGAYLDSFSSEQGLVDSPGAAGLDGLHDSAEFVRFLESYLSNREFSNLEFFAVGDAVIEKHISEKILPNAVTIAIVTLILTLIISSIVLKSQSFVFWSNTIVLVSCLWLMGFISLVGLDAGFMLSMVFSFVLTIGIADSVHLLSGYQFYRERGYEHFDAIKQTYKKTGLAIFYTTATTIAGMLVLAFAPLKAVQVFGITTAVGVAFAFVLTIFMMPLMLELWRPKIQNLVIRNHGDIPVIDSWYNRALDRVIDLVLARPVTNVCVFTIFFVVMLIGTGSARVDYHVLDGFDPQSDIVQAFDVMDERLSGTASIEIFLETGELNSLKSDARLIRELYLLQQGLSDQLGTDLIRANSIVDTIKQFQGLVSVNSESSWGGPETDYQLGQLMFFLTSANPEEISGLVTKDFDKTHVTLNLRTSSLSEFTEIKTLVEAQVETFRSRIIANYPEAKVHVTGGAVVENRVIEQISQSQLYGILTAILMISAMLFLMFSSLKYAAIALFVNLVPLSTVSGLMGFMGIPVGIYTLIVMPLILGLIVDDTIHFTTHYREEIASGRSTSDAIYITLSEAGQAVTFTTLILLASFVPLIFIEHREIQSVGILSTVALTVALSAEFLLLPPLLKLFASAESQSVTALSGVGDKENEAQGLSQ